MENVHRTEWLTPFARSDYILFTLLVVLNDVQLIGLSLYQINVNHRCQYATCGFATRVKRRELLVEQELLTWVRPRRELLVEQELLTWVRPRRELLVEQELLTRVRPRRELLVEQELLTWVRPRRELLVGQELLTRVRPRFSVELMLLLLFYIVILTTIFGSVLFLVAWRILYFASFYLRLLVALYAIFNLFLIPVINSCLCLAD